MTEIESHSPLSMRPFMFSGHDTNLTGRTVGKLTVRGVYVAPATKRGLRRWACQCSCGSWVTRVTRSLTNPKNNRDACRTCHTKQENRRREERIAAGEYEPAWLETVAARRGAT